MASNGRNGRPWERIKAHIKATSTHCCKCGRELDPDRVWPDPWSTSIDHIVPLALGGSTIDPSNLAAAHLRCNVREGNQVRIASRRTTPMPFTDDAW